MSDQSYLSCNAILKTGELQDCLSDLFDHPERQLRAAFARLIELLHEQAAGQLKLHKSFDTLSEKEVEKEKTISSCFVQIEKLSNDYQFCRKANDDLLRSMNQLSLQLKVRLCSMFVEVEALHLSSFTSHDFILQAFVCNST